MTGCRRVDPLRSIVASIVWATATWPATVHACACCGDQDWQSDSPVSDYDLEILDQLHLGSGYFYFHGDDGLEIFGGKREGKSFVFTSAGGAITFVPGAAIVQHWQSDITFITKPHATERDMVDILHQIIFTGTLRLPDATAWQLRGNSYPATLVFRGVGNSCLETDTIQRWQISSPIDQGWLTGGGPVNVESALPPAPR